MAQLARASGLGPEDCGFKSHYPDTRDQSIGWSFFVLRSRVKSNHTSLILLFMLHNQPWENITHQKARNYNCGHKNCGRDVSSEKGWVHKDKDGRFMDGCIYECPNCRRPTFFDINAQTQLPGVTQGGSVKHLPHDIETLYNEIREETGYNAFTSAVLVGRKLLMHIAVEQGAEKNLNFLQYVDYLVENHFAPPKSKIWVDKIRKLGNEANHEIITMTKENAQDTITFLEMLLKFIYEFPGPNSTVSVSVEKEIPKPS